MRPQVGTRVPKPASRWGSVNVEQTNVRAQESGNRGLTSPEYELPGSRRREGTSSHIQDSLALLDETSGGLEYCGRIFLGVEVTQKIFSEAGYLFSASPKNHEACQWSRTNRVLT